MIAHRKRPIFILIILSIAICCNSEKKIQQQVFDDYILNHFTAWSDAMGMNYVPEFYYKAGDSLQLESEISILKMQYDTTSVIPFSSENYLKLDSGTYIMFATDERAGDFGGSVEVIAQVGDTTFRGIAFTEQILVAQWGQDYLTNNREKLLKYLITTKKEGLRKLSEKYEVGEDSILTLISNEYFIRTGRKGINY